jgi:hypothetical protein
MEPWLFLIIWLLIGFASAIHSILLIHKKLRRLYPNRPFKYDNPFALDPVGSVLYILFSTFFGPITLLANLIIFWREF